MALLTNAVRGTQDILPQESHKWHFLERILREEAEVYGFSEIRTPVFEHTELFSRSAGESSDVVQKEMYTFLDKGNRSLTLRPEGTAGVLRAFLEHGLHNEPLPAKLSYFSSCYRYEKPQAGRLREFHQFGLEVLGTQSPAADAELIQLANGLFKRLNLKGIALQINSIGCPNCRKNYYKALRQYFSARSGELCETCLKRLGNNPMRILDCKNTKCIEIAQQAPTVLEYLCDECREHFSAVRRYLDEVKVKYEVNPRIVRGLDYYTKTVFEFVSSEIGAQGAIGGGGRYDGLVQELGGPAMPSIGFAFGMERLLMLLEKQSAELPEPLPCSLYIASIGENAQLKAFALTQKVRQAGLFAVCDIVGKSVKAQMKYANKIGAQFCMVLGDEEIANGVAELKNMATKEVVKISLNGRFLHEFMACTLDLDGQNELF